MTVTGVPSFVRFRLPAAPRPGVAALDEGHQPAHRFYPFERIALHGGAPENSRALLGSGLTRQVEEGARHAGPAATAWRPPGSGGKLPRLGNDLRS